MLMKLFNSNKIGCSFYFINKIYNIDLNVSVEFKQTFQAI